MTRKEAIKLLVNATYSEEWQGNEQLAKAQHMAIEALEQEASEAIGKWIPVGERLPEPGVKVMCCDDREDIYFGYHDFTGWYWEAEACAAYWAKDDNVIAWMPLPEPYKGGDTE